MQDPENPELSPENVAKNLILSQRRKYVKKLSSMSQHEYSTNSS